MADTIGRAAMEAAISRGGAVLYQGRIISRVADLPSEAELAQGDPAAEQAAAESLRAQIAQAQQLLAQLQARQPAGEQQPAGGEQQPAGEPKRATKAKE